MLRGVSTLESSGGQGEWASAIESVTVRRTMQRFHKITLCWFLRDLPCTAPDDMRLKGMPVEMIEHTSFKR